MEVPVVFVAVRSICSHSWAMTA